MFNAVDLPRHWRKPLLCLVLATLACIVEFRETWISIVNTWIHTETFAHGFVVAPISIWLVWMRKDQYRDLQPQVSLAGLILMAACGFLWLNANLIHALVIQEWAVVGVLVCSYWTILGNTVTRNMLFPILFLFLMVPFGEDFVPYLMEYTATFVVGMLRLTGISVYREGLHFTLTTGNWSVIDACSGIRYLIASITLGSVFAYLNYSSYKKRAWLMLASVVVPILANGLRAYMIVMIGHLSDMKLATGVDHLVYGWLFFGIVMLLLFYVGSFWQDPLPAPAEDEVADNDADATPVYVYRYYWRLMTAMVLCFSIWPMILAWVTGHQAMHVEIPEQFLQPSINQWQKSNAPDWVWEPQFKGIVASAQNYLSNGESIIGFFAASFGDESHGELVNSQNYLVPKADKFWQVFETSRVTINWPAGNSIKVDETVLSSNRLDLLVFNWYRIGSENTANAYYAKWLQLFKRLSGDTSPELKIVIYTETPHGDYKLAEVTLKKFAEACCR